MGDRASTTVLAWPWPGETNLPEEACRALAEHGIDGIDQAPDRTSKDASLLDGEEHFGVILAIADDEANYGTEAYRALIGALHETGLNVFAKNGAGYEYDPGWEFHPAGGEMIQRGMSAWLGATVISAGELLEACRAAGSDATELADVDDGPVGAAAKRLLAEPELPRAVWEAM